MQKHLQKCLLLLCFILSCSMFAQNQSPVPQRGVVRVKLQPEIAVQLGIKPMSTRNGIVTTGITPFDRASQQVKAVKMERVFPYVEKFEANYRKIGLDRWYKITFDETMDPKVARQIYSKVPGVNIAENIVPMSLVEGNKGFVELSPSQIQAMNTRATAMPFNDPMLSLQWHYNNDGSMSGSVKGSDINVFEAWKEITGSKDVLIAIVDGGVDYKHIDLSANMWVNEAELNGIPGVDDDNNGYVDDIYGYNFVTNSGDVYPQDHGTHVAGTVGAINNNGIGVCGVAGGNGHGGVKMVSSQVFDPRTSAAGDFANAIVYAANVGASIAQCSWGWPSPDYKEEAVMEAIDYFTEFGGGDKLKGGLCIFASGNNGESGNYYPGCYEKVLSVGSMTYDKKPASYSNYGSWVDITAPGGLMDYATAQGVLSTLPSDKYGYNEGTSMAAPHVSGIAALVLSKIKGSNFSNESLRQQLITSVNDFYANNPGVAGLFGSGYIDASKSLQMSTGKAPDVVTDFTLLPAQDNITVEWTIPNAEGNAVFYHSIYYSTKPFTAASDLSKIPNKQVDTRFNASGEKFTYEIAGLSSLTSYYVAIVPVDRWGNAAELSVVKSAQTNAGPKMILDKTNITFNLDASASPVVSDNFIIRNEAEGLLKWEYLTRTGSVTMSSLTKPHPGNLASFGGKMSAKAAQTYPVITADYMAEDYPKSFTYAQNLAAYIGESDLTLSNSAAQWFVINPDSFPEGFNLTAINLSSFMGNNPVIEIYEGNKDISKAALLQRFTPSYYYHMYDQNLTEQLFFAPGESFWIVAHFPKNQKNPLGMATAANTLYKSYSYYSSDNGQTWSLLSEVLREGNFADIAEKATWNIRPISKNPDWSKVLTLDPASGQVKSGESKSVAVSNDGQKLINGNYKFKLILKTNESENPQQEIAVKLNVSNYEPILKTTTKIVDFGDLLIGKSKKLTVELVNVGYGAFKGKNGALDQTGVKCTSDQFKVPTYIKDGFPARSKSYMNVEFKPTKAGSHTASVILTDKNGIEYKIMIRGVAIEPAKIAIDKTSFDEEIGELVVGGETKNVTFTIKNEGKYPLEYVFPKFSSEQIKGMGTTSHKFGYSYISNLEDPNGFVYDGNPALVNATDITSQYNDNNIWSEEVDLGFDFPYYGKTYSKMYIGSYGVMAVATGPMHQCSVPAPDATCIKDLGLISVYGASQLRMGADSKVEYAKQDGKFVVKFTNVMAVVYDNEYTPVSFHFTLSSNGDVECFYDSYDPAIVFGEGQGLFVGLNDIEVKDPITMVSTDTEGDLYTKFTSGSAVKFIAPGKSMIQKLSSTDGVIGIDESRAVTVTVGATEGMYAGELTNGLVLLSSDPSQSTSYINLKATITGDLKPAAKLENENVDFGNVFRTADIKKVVTLKNTGTDKLIVKGAAVTEGKFTLDAFEYPLTIAPGNSKDFLVTLPTITEGAVEDEIVITLNDDTTLKATIKGNVIGVPTADLNMEAIEVTAVSGDKVEKTLVLSNNGNETLEYSIVPNEMINLKNQVADANSKIDYIYNASVDYKNVKFDWVNIETNGKGTQHKLVYYMNHDFVEVELPYEIPFYGKTYKNLYIYGSGFISFTKRVDQHEFPEPPMELPSNGTFYDNIIAPYWGMHTMDQTQTAGTFYCIEDDRVIVSFMEYGNTMNRGVCFQAVINRNGTFKYQYKFSDNGGDLQNMYGVAGIQNSGATKGINLPSRCVEINQAVEFYPVKTEKVAAKEQREIEMSVMTNQMAGKYSGTLKVNTNVPARSMIELPIDLTITGTPVPVYPKSVGSESVIGVYDMMTGAYTVDFEISNSGTAMFDITDVVSDLVFASQPWGGLSKKTRGFAPDQLYYYTTKIDPDFGDVMTGYFAYEPGTPIQIGKVPAKFRVMFYSYDEIGTYNIPMAFQVTGLDVPEIQIPFNHTITPAPVMEFDKPEIRLVNVADNFKDNASMKISNNGEYKLTYELVLDPTGVGATDDEGGSGLPDTGIMSKNDRKVLSAEQNALLVKNVTATTFADEEEPAYNPDLPVGGGYTNALYYPAFPNNYKIYLFGANDKYSDYIAATQYKAPAEGFNLSDIYFYATIGDQKNVTIKAEIIEGTDVTTGKVIGTGSLFVESEEPIGEQGGVPIYNGAFRMLTLDKPVFLNPNEDFYVKIIIPAGFEYAVALMPKEDAVVANRYMAWAESYNWVDVGAELENSYGSLGHVMTCIEHIPGEPWIKMLNEQTSGIIEPEGALDVNFALNAYSARLDKENKAALIIRSNDPNQPVVNYPIYLDKNVAPSIVAPSKAVYVKENATVQTNITVSDLESESFTVKLKDEKGIAALESYTVSPSNAVVTREDDNTLKVEALESGDVVSVTLTIALSAKYGDAGDQNFIVTAVDKSENTSSKNVRYYVQHVNRAPEAMEQAVIEMTQGTMTPVINFATLFEDPDGDAMTYTMKLSDKGIVDAYVAAESVIFAALKKGEVSVTVTAKDAAGATAENTFKVKVIDGTGIEGTELKNSVSIYPNPVIDKANVKCDVQGEVSYKLYDANGALLHNESANTTFGQVHTIDMSGCAAGIYYLELTVEGVKTTLPVVKK